jgi:hypothetical protein
MCSVVRSLLFNKFRSSSVGDPAVLDCSVTAKRCRIYCAYQHVFFRLFFATMHHTYNYKLSMWYRNGLDKQSKLTFLQFDCGKE